jgi:hypothetical protein
MKPAAGELGVRGVHHQHYITMVINAMVIGAVVHTAMQTQQQQQQQQQ